MTPASRSENKATALDRRHFLWRTGGGFGAVALAHLMRAEGLLADQATSRAQGPRPSSMAACTTAPKPGGSCSFSCRARPVSATRSITSPRF